MLNLLIRWSVCPLQPSLMFVGKASEEYLKGRLWAHSPTLNQAKKVRQDF